MSLFASYEHDFTVSITDVNKKIQLIPDLSGDEKQREIKSAERDLREAKELVDQMRLESGSAPAAERASLRGKVDTYNATLQKAERDLRQARTAISHHADRAELFGYDGTSDDDRAALLSNTELLNRGTGRLGEGDQLLDETIGIGESVLSNLHSQRDVIHSARRKVGEVHEDLSKSSRILSRIINRAKQHKVMTAGIIIVALIIIIMIIYLIATKHS